MPEGAFAEWTRRFEDERERRRAQGDPDWTRGATLHPAVWAGIQRFQVGEDGDGSSLVGKADRAGDADYARAARLFVAEEQNHARLLARLLAAGGRPTLTGHWSDTVFVRLRRLLGLRTELLVLMIAEVVALRYYRALRDGAQDPLTSDVAGRILSDEERHVPFHCARLHTALAGLPRPLRRPVMLLWRLLLLAVCLAVAADHGPALRRLGVGRPRFVADVMTSSAAVTSAVLEPDMPVRTTTADVVTIRTEHTRALWLLVALGTAGAALAVLRLLRGGGLLDVWLLAGLLLASLGLTALYWVTATVCGDAHGLRRRTLLRRRGVAWSDIADLRVQRHHGHRGTTLRVAVVLRDGRVRLLPLPYASTHDEEDFDRRTAALRALLHQYGTPASDHLAVVSHRTAGYGGPVRPLALAALLLACAAAAAWFVPGVAADERAWRSAAPCPAGTSAAQPRDADREPPARDCLSTAPAVIERIDVNGPKQRSVLHFAGHPLETAGVPRDAALEYRPGDEVRLTVWRGRVMRIAGEHHVWQEHVSTARAQAAVAAGLVLAAGWPGAVALLRLRARRLPADEVLPSALPFAGVLAGTALWLLPLCYLHPTSPLGSPTTISWAAAGSLATLALLAGAWHATRVRAPRGPATPRDPGSDRPENAENAEGPEGPEGPATGQPETEAEAFLPARFLEHTDYNPHGFGTHIVLGGGEPAVTPHAGPGRFAARRIPAQRLSLERIRRPRGDDGDTVPRGWHVAELDDAGTPVRLAAAPSDLTRILRALGCADPAAPAAGRTTTRDGERHPRNP